VFRLRYGLPDGVCLRADLSVGQFVRVKIPGERKPRSYSPTEVGIPGEVEFCIKRYKGGRVSSYLCGANVGDSVLMSGPFPPFWIPFKRTGNAQRIGVIAFGIGITEVLPLTKLEMNTGSAEVRVLWANRQPRDVFDTADFSELQRKHEELLKVTFIFSREKGKASDLFGHITDDILKLVFGDWLDRSPVAYFLVVGTRRMKRDGYAMLQRIGFTHKLISRQPCGCCFR